MENQKNVKILNFHLLKKITEISSKKYWDYLLTATV